MVRARGLGVMWGLVLLTLSSCSLSFGPTLANTLDVNLELTVNYVDGGIRNLAMPPGMTARIGKGEPPVNLFHRQAVPIQEMVIKAEGRLLHRFNFEEVRLLTEKERANRGTQWCVARESVYLVQVRPEDYPVSDGREQCSKGKRID